MPRLPSALGFADLVATLPGQGQGLLLVIGGRPVRAQPKVCGAEHVQHPGLAAATGAAAGR
jgi:hypothetical protein